MNSRSEECDPRQEREALVALERSFPLAGVLVAIIWLAAHTAVEPTSLTDPAVWAGVIGIVWVVASLFVVVGFCLDPEVRTEDQTYLAPIALWMTPAAAFFLASPEANVLGVSVFGLIGLVGGMFVGSCQLRRHATGRLVRKQDLRHG